ncbi:MAG: hypothetical protein ABJH04_19600 [Cyclobacteriaceae bacterium]
MTKRLFPIITLILLTQFAFSQKNLVPGYIIRGSQDTVRGYIQDRGWDQNPKEILFKKSLAEDAVKYNASQIKEFKINGGPHYFAFIVDIDKSAYKVSQMEKYLPSKSNVRDTIFMEMLDRGKLDLLRLRDESDKYHFYYNSGNGTPKELILKIVFTQNNGMTSMLITENYKAQLKDLMVECQSVQQEINELKYVET